MLPVCWMAARVYICLPRMQWYTLLLCALLCCRCADPACVAIAVMLAEGGLCMLAQGQECGTDSHCTSRSCKGNKCCGSPTVPNCRVCNSTGECAEVLLEHGQACSRGDTCRSGLCAAGRCCLVGRQADSYPSTQTCQSCDESGFCTDDDAFRPFIPLVIVCSALAGLGLSLVAFSSCWLCQRACRHSVGACLSKHRYRLMNLALSVVSLVVIAFSMLSLTLSWYQRVVAAPGSPLTAKGERVRIHIPAAAMASASIMAVFAGAVLCSALVRALQLVFLYSESLMCRHRRRRMPMCRYEFISRALTGIPSGRRARS
jgi:hypothetical protein